MTESAVEGRDGEVEEADMSMRELEQAARCTVTTNAGVVAQFLGHRSGGGRGLKLVFCTYKVCGCTACPWGGHSNSIGDVGFVRPHGCTMYVWYGPTAR